MKRALIAVSALALLGACAQQPGGETSQAAGVGIGAVTGAAIGAGLGLLVGGNDRRNAAVGAGIGAVAGGAVAPTSPGRRPISTRIWPAPAPPWSTPATS